MNCWIWDQCVATANDRWDKTAITYGAHAVTFGELIEEAQRVAPALQGDRETPVALSAHNSIDLVVAILGVWRAGRTPALIHPDTSEAHMMKILGRLGVDSVYTDDLSSKRASRYGFKAVLEGEAPNDLVPEPISLKGDDDASVIFTSGSTGTPKGIVQKSTTLIDGARRVAEMLRIRQDDTVLCPVPFSFDYGWGQLLSCFITGTPIVLPTLRNATGLCQALAEHQPTVIAGVPAVMAELCLGLSPIEDTPTDSVRLITNTGSRLPKAVYDAMRRTFPKAHISLNYGLTETYRTSSLPPSETSTHLDSVGPAIPGVEIVVLGEDGAVVPCGEVGEILHVGAGTFDRYWGEPEKTSSIRITWAERPAVRTGDYGSLDHRGYLTLVGRRDRQVKCMGVRISLDEVEETLSGLPSLSEVAVISQAHDMLGELIIACVVPDDESDDEKTLRKAVNLYAREHLSPFMQPRVVHRLEKLPRNVNGKIDYKVLCQTFA